MSATFGNLRPDAALWAAQLALSQLARRIAASGFAAIRESPGLLADVDQHAAAVRDALIEISGRVSAVGLAAYADGVCDSAGRHGWQLPGEHAVLDWTQPEWPLVRLLAVCVLADQATVLF